LVDRPVDLLLPGFLLRAFFLVLAGSVAVVSVEVDAGGVVAAAGAGVVVAAGAGVVVAAGAGVVVAAVGAVVVAPVPLPDEVWASTTLAGRDNAITVAIREAFCMEKTPTSARPAMQSA
jgi:hypothetical protein